MKFLSLLALPLALALPVEDIPRGPAPPVLGARVEPAPELQARYATPTVVIPFPQATIVGLGGADVEQFPGIPFAKPPVGDLRLKSPQPLTEPLGTYQATKNQAACPQFFFSDALDDSIPTSVLGQILNSPFVQKITQQSEDCLYLNVHRPAGVAANAKLPVLFWMFGGGFELGWNTMYDGSPWVKSSIEQGKPIIFVTVNYRIGGFGFLPGTEILKDGSSNLGLKDQRLGLQWVADNIASFGGDPDKVTIWGESAGAISVFDQMVINDGDHTYKGKPLFRGGIMNSGSVIPADPVDCPKGQVVYDTVVEAAGCKGNADTLACLRSVPYQTYLNAANSVPGLLSHTSVALSYLPRPDGVFLTQSPDVLVLNGKYAKVPFIVGDQEDEGTLFALFQSYIKTPADMVKYLTTVFFHHSTDAQMSELIQTYPIGLLDGSPFRTGIFNNWYPEFKRLAAILGDLTFTLSRRVMLLGTSTIAPDVPSWSYLSSYDYGTPVMGTFHGSDLIQVFFGIYPNYAAASFRAYYLSFVATMDPNNGTDPKYRKWPQWKDGNQLLNTYATYSQLIKDDFRSKTYDFIVKNIKSLYI
jgi:carboxylesterase type B